jgi:putative intracellular protease/amidase
VLVKYLIESKFRELGGKFEQADDWHPKAAADGNLIAGQNGQSSEVTAELLVKALRGYTL